jgi:hypothetical protein
VDRADARLAEAKARLAKIKPPLPTAPAPRRSKSESADGNPNK